MGLQLRMMAQDNEINIEGFPDYVMPFPENEFEPESSRNDGVEEEDTFSEVSDEDDDEEKIVD